MNNDRLTATAARRTRLKWEASRDLQKALKAKGADSATVQVYAEKLAEALRGGGVK